MTKLLGNLIFEGVLLGVTALLLWTGYWGWRERKMRELSERDEFISDLVNTVQGMIPEGQGEGFDAGRWIARWLETPQPALGGASPKAYLDTGEGRAIVRRLLGAIESGAYV